MNLKFSFPFQRKLNENNLKRLDKEIFENDFQGLINACLYREKVVIHIQEFSSVEIETGNPLPFYADPRKITIFHFGLAVRFIQEHAQYGIHISEISVHYTNNPNVYKFIEFIPEYCKNLAKFDIFNVLSFDIFN